MSEAIGSREDVAHAVQAALREGPFTLRNLAEEMDGSYGTVREWSRGARTPTDASVERIAVSLERRGRMLLELAERLRRVVASRRG